MQASELFTSAQCEVTNADTRKIEGVDRLLELHAGERGRKMSDIYRGTSKKAKMGLLEREQIRARCDGASLRARDPKKEEDVR